MTLLRSKLGILFSSLILQSHTYPHQMDGPRRIQDRFDASLLRKRIASRRQHTSFKSLYGHKEWVEDLDIVNELGGHTGCVNALRYVSSPPLLLPFLTFRSWSKSGELLASGSDDTHLNIWSYNPESLASPFTLKTCVSTGHVANIFSTKFMPHSNDRTVVTCAGDAEVRVFDIERGGSSGNASREARAASTTRSQRFQNFFPNAGFLNDGNTNSRVYRSHADRVKRIVTESSPHLFLTCSEDGEVRQWDLRQPSSAYPAPRGGQGFMSYRQGDEHDAGNVPPPLISYKSFNLDLNTISCSPSQPYYIALGGAHLHCFLHDRRMTGRSVAAEWGRPASATPEPGSHEDELMGTATRCVRRFAPEGKPDMTDYENGHITACKISDANPNEMIVSWSGGHIYSFDIVQSPDAREAEATKARQYQERQAQKARQARDRKRKRQANSTASLNEHARAKMALRREREDEGEISLRVRYGNGQSENIPVEPSGGESINSRMEQTRDSLLTESQKLGDRIAKALVKLRKTIFDLQNVVAESESPPDLATSSSSSSQLTPHTDAFTATLGYATSLLPQIRECMTAWRYPMEPTREEVALQQILRRDRQASERLVQAAGTLARVLGGKLQTVDPENDERLDHFRQIRPASLERDDIDRSSEFAYDFLKAILLWLEGGREALVDGFKKGPPPVRYVKRFPIDADDCNDPIGRRLIPYLLALADDKPIVNIDASRFELDENRTLFPTQTHAVQSFARSVNGYDLGWSSEPSMGPNGPRQRLDRGASYRFWGVKVGRSLLMTAGEGVNYEFTNRAFGGVGINIVDEASNGAMDVERDREDIDVNESDPEVEMVSLEARRPTVEDVPEVENGPELQVQPPSDSGRSSQQQATSVSTTAIERSEVSSEDQADEASITSESLVLNRDTSANFSGLIDEASTRSDDNDNEDVGEDDDDDSDTFESDSDADCSDERVIFRNSLGFGRARHRRRHIDGHTSCGSHTRTYKGHCNIKTVKDVNYYGPNDEYVISGSDDGNFFIWDRKTTKLLNILEGDGEVVNVIQGHPYEPMIAASGIDNTIKIFSPDARLQEEARKGRNVANPGGLPSSSLRLRRRPTHTTTTTSPSSASTTTTTGIPTTIGLESRKRMDDEYGIISRNDMSRQGGVGDAFLTVSFSVSPCLSLP